MKELAKSLFSYSLAMTLFGLKQFDNLLSSNPPGEPKAPAIKALDSLTSATTAQFDETLQNTFHALDNLQRDFVELTFSAMFSFARSTVSSHDSKDPAGKPSVAEPRLWTEAVVDRPQSGTKPGPEPVSSSERVA